MQPAATDVADVVRCMKKWVEKKKRKWKKNVIQLHTNIVTN